ncbi:hypothetical protein LCGC14_0426880 [marine sediment metagenome]|uniref:Glycosyltransferase 2-like domain-containing protein n=1 Tax=marine sediment metagenome TaxID=412755 RepID=A0A0F9VB83_9ZZZZ
MEVAIIIVAASGKQRKCFWPSYNAAEHGIDHDLIVVHRNREHLTSDIENDYGKIIYENKIRPNGELPHKAFGAYREYWNKYKDKYEFFAFISDDVIIKTDGWLLEAVLMLERSDKLGFVGSQIFNGLKKQYPHKSHCRAPIWFAKSERLKDIKWNFNSDHDGEMNLGQQFLAAGYFGAQVGNKFDFAYDALEYSVHFKGHHICHIMEKEQFNSAPGKKISYEKREMINKKILGKLHKEDDSVIVTSPIPHIGQRRLVSQLQPYNGLILDIGSEIAKPYSDDFPFDIQILRGSH